MLLLLYLFSGVQSALGALSPRLKDFHSLLVEPPPVGVFQVITVNSLSSLPSISSSSFYATYSEVVLRIIYPL